MTLTENRDSSSATPYDVEDSEMRCVQNAIKEALKNLSHGNIVITVHGGSVEQIDVIKKIRPFRSETTGRRR